MKKNSATEGYKITRSRSEGIENPSKRSNNIRYEWGTRKNITIKMIHKQKKTNDKIDKLLENEFSLKIQKQGF